MSEEKNKGVDLDNPELAGLSEVSEEHIKELEIDLLKNEIGESPDLHFDVTNTFFRSLKTDKLTEALSLARAEFKPVKRSGKVDFTNNKGQCVKYDYSTKDDMIASTVIALSKQGLTFNCLVSVQPEKKSLTCSVVYVRASIKHVSDQEEGSYLSARVVKGEKQQQSDFLKSVAATSTYLIRLAYSSIVGLSSSEPDNDGMTPKELVQAQNEELHDYTDDLPKLGVEEQFIDFDRANKFIILAESKGMTRKELTTYILKRTKKTEFLKLTESEVKAMEAFIKNKKECKE